MKPEIKEADLRNRAKAVADAVLMAVGSGGLKCFMPCWQERITEAAMNVLQSQERASA